MWRILHKIYIESLMISSESAIKTFFNMNLFSRWFQRIRELSSRSVPKAQHLSFYKQVKERKKFGRLTCERRLARVALFGSSFLLAHFCAKSLWDMPIVLYSTWNLGEKKYVWMSFFGFRFFFSRVQFFFTAMLRIFFFFFF